MRPVCSFVRRMAWTLAALLLAAWPGQAQMNPQWQSSAMHDFLDLYQQNTSAKVRPEIVTLFDFSGSMGRIMFHGSYPNQYSLEEGDGALRKSYYSVRVTLSGPAGLRVATPSLYESDTDGNGTEPLSANYAVTGVGLVRPDGSLVTESLVANTITNSKLPGSSSKAADVRNWVRAASHARIRFQYPKAGPTLDRTLDIPLHWCVIDPAQTLSSSDPTLKSLKIVDPNNLDAAHGPYEVDSTYLDENGSGNVLRMDNNSTTVNLKEASGTWRYDYIDWFVRRAIDPSNASKFLIRSAGDSDWIVTDANGTHYSPYGPPITDPDGNIYYSGLPCVTRLQAVKQACLMVWFQYQDDVFWSFRGLDSASYSSFSSSTDADPPSSVTVPTDNTTNGATKHWVSFKGKASNGQVHMGAKRLAKLGLSGGTPMYSSYSELLAQYENDSPWSYMENDGEVLSCTKHFILLMTDGNPKDEGAYSEAQANMPYWTGAKAGNVAIKANTAGVNFNGTFWNLPTLAGAAAHAADPGNLLGVVVGDPLKTHTGSKVSDYLPFAINHRSKAKAGVGPNLNPAHPIQTITVGISLGKDLNNASSTVTPDFRLRAAACFGNPYKVTWPDPTTTLEFNPDAPNGVHDPREAFFFDASSAQKLVRSMNVAFQYMMSTPSSNVTAMPSIPYVGVGLGHQIYLGRFDPPKQGGPVWPGDLMMFPTKEQNGQTLLLNQDGTQISTDLKTATPGWKASTVLHSKGWQNRTFYTRLPATVSDWNPAIQPVSDSGANWTAIKSYIPGVDDAHKLSLLRWMMGADITSNDSPLPTRNGTDPDQVARGVVDVMGDVIDSSPAVVEYTLTSSLIASLPSTLSGVAKTDGSTRFRVIFVGTNQGLLHAFGEVSWTEKTGTTTETITRAVADELWAFIPTDVLRYLSYYETPTNAHRAAVNGVPVIYHLDLPASGNLRGNGTVDSTEWAQVIFGLGKGGRSYYAIDIRNPMSPQLGESGDFTGWALVPDEAYSYPAARFEADATTSSAITNMGYSTNVPAIGRVIVGDPTTGGTMRDVLFLGGGYSFYDIETNYPTKNANTALGRSIIALDTSTGKVVKIWDLSSVTGLGPISVGVVPFRFFANMGMTQRLYFTDLFGGLWCINSTKFGTNAGAGQDFSKFRIDSSMLKDWASVPRPIYKQSGSNGIQSALPAPFRVGTFYARTTAPIVIPEAVGIAMVSGDRNNPLDLGYSNKNPAPYSSAPSQHRLTVVFDRQDSYLEGLDTPGSTVGGITDTKLQDMSGQISTTANVINPASSSFYLANGKYGYYINMPTGSTYASKGIVPPTVLSGVVFWSYLTPQAVDPCIGGTGYTYTNRLCDVMRPVFPGNGVDASTTTSYQGCQSGQVATWYGVASNIAAKSIVAVIQAGNVAGAIDPNTGLPISTLTTKTFSGKFSSSFAQPRTWRTVR